MNKAQKASEKTTEHYLEIKEGILENINTLIECSDIKELKVTLVAIETLFGDMDSLWGLDPDYGMTKEEE